MIMSLSNTFTQKSRMQAVFGRPRKLLFVGIGGIGMHALAIMMTSRGHTVIGTDRSPSPAVVAGLAAHGIPLYTGHSAAHVAGCDALVYTLAVSPESPELVAAQQAGIPCFSRADILGYLMGEAPTRVAVAGMHGKSTVTAMLAAVLQAAGKDPTVVSGAPLSAGGAAFLQGKGDIFLAEACEYRDSFLCLDPTVAVVLNAELEHTDYFRTESDVRRSFIAFMQGAASVILPTAPTRVPLSPPQGSEVFTFGTEKEAFVRAENFDNDQGAPTFDLYIGEKKQGRAQLKLLGEHNVQNALAACAAALACGIDPSVSVKALCDFTGTPMRLEEKGMRRGVRLYADYAHHPTEIRASLAALRRVTAKTGGRLFCLFQPHTYSRTASFFCDFADALSAADRVILADIYAARERNESGVSSEVLANSISRGVYAADLPTAVRILDKEAWDGDLAVIMGAGDIHRIFSLL
ncbi:MAG: UDP-N-acetylmuramate--L-alanine ligase [Clostridia bacterium]|nr:UDP-N-acetylmuramate--L-alanine ligase [Clostridia bacterium]MBQ8859673.1 UDP-N-acetylmuramate--L-alanine ligase [Clostridia bacterium]